MVDKTQKIEEVLTRGVEKILPNKEGLAKLMSQKKIRLYLGVDPTSPNLHLGHVIPLRKLQQFADLGHEAILLFGTFTAQIGDPSGRDERRKPLTAEQVEKNMADYQKQASKVLNFSKVKIKRNGDWLSKLTFSDVSELASRFTVPRIMERDMFQERLKKGEDIWLNEFLYPLMQGYDSVAMDVDLEIGGNDQTFNMLAGRKLQKDINKKEKFVLTTPMLVGLDGRKMSKTFDNTVNIADEPNEMYGKIMSLKDELIIPYFQICTDIESREIAIMEKELKANKINPRDTKARLAGEIVKMYHGEKAAKAASIEFDRVFKDKKLPQDIDKISIKEKEMPIIDLLVKTKLAVSKSSAKRLIIQGAVKIDDKPQSDWQAV
ncbi:MAG: tyrosine--tRNA ligase, partial [Patescibacteria group bacterium]